MREIKLRVYDAVGEMHYLDTEDTDDALVFRSDRHFGGYLFDGDLVVMQYTGYYDSHGKEIYEGDIVRHNGRKCIVTFVFAKFVLVSDDELIDELHSALINLVVIGNIYEGVDS